jgi:hypothetical protein
VAHKLVREEAMLRDGRRQRGEDRIGSPDGRSDNGLSVAGSIGGLVLRGGGGGGGGGALPDAAQDPHHRALLKRVAEQVANNLHHVASATLFLADEASQVLWTVIGEGDCCASDDESKSATTSRSFRTVGTARTGAGRAGGAPGAAASSYGGTRYSKSNFGDTTQDSTNFGGSDDGGAGGGDDVHTVCPSPAREPLGRAVRRESR